jgi:hypothetical protein
MRVISLSLSLLCRHTSLNFFLARDGRRTILDKKAGKKKRKFRSHPPHKPRFSSQREGEKEKRERERERGKASKQARIETIQHGQNFSSFFERKRSRGLRVVRLLCFVFVF